MIKTEPYYWPYTVKEHLKQQRMLIFKSRDMLNRSYLKARIYNLYYWFLAEVLGWDKHFRIESEPIAYCDQCNKKMNVQLCNNCLSDK